jgi:hypothetical protein
VNAQKVVNFMTLDNDPKCCETKSSIQLITVSSLSLHPFWATTFKLAILGSHKNPSTPSLVHQQMVIHHFPFCRSTLHHGP